MELLAKWANSLWAWLTSVGGMAYGFLSDSRTATLIGVVYTLTMLYFLLRDKWWRQRKPHDDQ